VIFPELAGEPGFAEQRATLALIAGLDLRLVIPGHGSMFEDVAGALARANARLDWLAGDPRRNAENAVKVMLKFLLLERRQLARASLAPLLASIPLAAQAGAAVLGMAPAELADWALSALLRAGAARIAGEMVLDV
jgi:hypothetical protein